MTILPEHIERITRLLDSYYSGVATQEEVEAISDFFQSADLAQLPENLREEAEMFALFDSGRDALADDVPAGLADSIMAAIDAAEAKSRRRQHRTAIIRFVGWLSTAAAVVAVAIGFGIRPGDNPDDFIPKPGEDDVIAEVEVPDQTNSEGDASNIVVGTVEVQDLSEGQHEYIAEARTLPVKDNYVEIVDPIEASILAQDVLSLISEKIALAGNTVREAKSGLKHVDNTLSDVMAVEPVPSDNRQYTRIIN